MAVATTLTLNAEAEVFFPTQGPAQSWNLRAEEFVPYGPNTFATDGCTMNANATEFSPSLGLSEFGQTMEGWQTLGQRLGTTVDNVNMLAINPAFLCDDESDDEFSEDSLGGKDPDKGSNDGDQESNAGNQESDKSAVDILNDFAKDMNEIITGDFTGNAFVVDVDTQKSVHANESDKETSFNEGSDADPQNSSADDSTSLGTTSDVESEDITSLQMSAPPGLSLPPWKVRPRAPLVDASSRLESESDSEFTDTISRGRRPWKIPPWKKAAGLRTAVHGEDALPAMSSPPWKRHGVSKNDSEAVQAPPGLILPPWKLPRCKSEQLIADL